MTADTVSWMNVLMASGGVFVGVGGLLVGMLRAARQEARDGLRETGEDLKAVRVEMRDSVARAHGRIDELARDVAGSQQTTAVISSQMDSLTQELTRVSETLGDIQRGQEELLIAVRTGEHCPVMDGVRMCDPC